MRKFDTRVQEIKYFVIKEVVKDYLNKNMENALYNIPKKIISGKKPTMRCCIYKERAILAERVKIVLNDDPLDNSNIIQFIDIACDECDFKNKYEVLDCHGCLAQRCEAVCPKDAIVFNNQRAEIDQSKCIECGRCYSSCQFNAIIKRERPCLKCPVKAISVDEINQPKIDMSKCIECGSCVYECPFGAITDNSFVLECLDLLMNHNENENVYALIAPSIASQFDYASIGQVITGLKKIGFKDVIEVALGADIVADNEAKELSNKELLFSSCCPSFVKYIEKFYPEFEKYLSESPSPMLEAAKIIKKTDSNALVVFIGPCISKKTEDIDKSLVDTVITFEELQAVFDGYELDLSKLEESDFDNASNFGRGFAKSGGVINAIKEAILENNINIDFKPIACNGLDEIKTTLAKLKQKKLDANFIEGMVCKGGCIGGPACVKHSVKDSILIDTYSNNSKEKNIKDSIKVFKKY